MISILRNNLIDKVTSVHRFYQSTPQLENRSPALSKSLNICFNPSMKTTAEKPKHLLTPFLYHRTLSKNCCVANWQNVCSCEKLQRGIKRSKFHKEKLIQLQIFSYILMQNNSKLFLVQSCRRVSWTLTFSEKGKY